MFYSSFLFYISKSYIVFFLYWLIHDFNLFYCFKLQICRNLFFCFIFDSVLYYVFFHSLLNYLIPKRIIKISHGSHIIEKILFQSKIYLSKHFFNELNCKISLIFDNRVYGRRHSKLFINCHVSWDTLYFQW